MDDRAWTRPGSISSLGQDAFVESFSSVRAVFSFLFAQNSRRCCSCLLCDALLGESKVPSENPGESASVAFQASQSWSAIQTCFNGTQREWFHSTKRCLPLCQRMSHFVLSAILPKRFMFWMREFIFKRIEIQIVLYVFNTKLNAKCSICVPRFAREHRESGATTSFVECGERVASWFCLLFTSNCQVNKKKKVFLIN